MPKSLNVQMVDSSITMISDVLDAGQGHVAEALHRGRPSTAAASYSSPEWPSSRRGSGCRRTESRATRCTAITEAMAVPGSLSQPTP